MRRCTGCLHLVKSIDEYLNLFRLIEDFIKFKFWRNVKIEPTTFYIHYNVIVRHYYRFNLGHLIVTPQFVIFR